MLWICALLSAGPARPVVFLTQPDGTSFEARMSGDEFMKIITDTKGHALIKDANGYWCYARYDSDGNKLSTGVVVGVSAPSEVLAASADIPYSTLSMKAESERQNVNAARASRPSILRRMSSASPIARGTMPAKKTCLVILAEFKDIPFTYGRDDFERVFNESGYNRFSAQGSVSDYFKDQLGGSCEFSFTVVGPYPLPGVQKDYGANSSRGGGDVNPGKAVKDACLAASNDGVNFSEFDDDNDGEVDNVFVIVSGKDEAEGGGEDAIWAHQWYLLDGAGIRLMLNGKMVNTYTICSELAYRSSGRTYKVATIGTFCHEYGHTFGLMDMYDVDGDSSGGHSNGIYGTGVMDTGCYNNDGNTPAHYNAIDYDTIGCGNPQQITTGEIILEPISENRRFFKIEGAVENEYYLIECRAKKGWDAYLSSRGLAIYHIDRSTNKVGNTTAAAMWKNDGPNNNPSHMCAMMVTPVSTSSSAKAFFPYNKVNSFTPAGDPSFTFWNGDPSEYAIVDIALNGDNVSFVVADAKEYLIPDIKSITADGFQDSAVISIETSNINYSGSAVLEYVAGGKTQQATLNNVGQGRLAAKLSDLEPGTSYKATVRLSVGEIEGDQVDASFTTKEIKEDGDPYIYFSSPTMIPLVVFDASGVEDIRWYYDGGSVFVGKDGYYRPSKSGRLKASIRYSDGDHETIIKDIVL